MQEDSKDLEKTPEERVAAKRHELAGMTREALEAHAMAVWSAQSGSDKRVFEVTRQRDELSHQIDEINAGKGAAELEAKTRALELKERALEQAAARGIPVQLARWIRAESPETIDKALDEIGTLFGDVAAEARRKYDRDHGRTPGGFPAKNHGPSTYGDLLAMSEEQLKRYSPGTIASIAERSK